MNYSGSPSHELLSANARSANPDGGTVVWQRYHGVLQASDIGALSPDDVAWFDDHPAQRTVRKMSQASHVNTRGVERYGSYTSWVIFVPLFVRSGCPFSNVETVSHHTSSVSRPRRR